MDRMIGGEWKLVYGNDNQAASAVYKLVASFGTEITNLKVVQDKYTTTEHNWIYGLHYCRAHESKRDYKRGFQHLLKVTSSVH